MDTPLAELADALQRFRHGGVEEGDLSTATQIGLRAALVRRFLTDQLEFVNIAKDYLTVADFHELCQHIVYPPRSHGRLGGKAAGLYLASKIVARSPEYHDVLGDIRIPRSWHIPSDGILDFIHHNDLEDVYNRKYTDPDRVRLDYPYIVQLFKNSFFSADILRGLSDVLDDLDGRPIIVRSSSLLEDRLGSAFSGKYKSLFLANTGTKRERLAALTDAIAEVYASVFSPDPIEYRALRGLLDLHEEMGILIQEVVGTRVGPYWMPAFSGVGFSNNEFRWSSRIAREDGLLRIVPGLGTRAVDRLADDYPVLVAPGQPGLRVNQTPEEALRYSPKKADVINLETGVFETVDMRELLERHGEEFPLVRQMISIADHDHLRRPVGLVDFSKDAVVLSFEGLISDSPFMTRMRTLLQVLREKLKSPVDIEFASDGRHVYLLQCRPQGATEGAAPVPIPRDLPQDRVLFTARRYVSNGQVSDVSHVVYVDPEEYARLELDRIREVGRAVGRLNRLLPEAPVHPDGPGPLGLPRGHPARRARHLRRHHQRGGARRGRPEEGRLRPRPLLRHPLLPGPRRVEHPLPAPLPRRPRGRLQRGLLPALAERAREPRPGVRGALGRPARDRRAARHRGACPARAHERGPRRGGRPPGGAHRGRGGAGRARDVDRAPPRRPLALAAAHGPADRGPPRPRPLRREGGLRLRLDEERHGRSRRATSTCCSTSSPTGRANASWRCGSTAGATPSPR